MLRICLQRAESKEDSVGRPGNAKVCELLKACVRDKARPVLRKYIDSK